MWFLATASGFTIEKVRSKAIEDSINNWLKFSGRELYAIARQMPISQNNISNCLRTLK
jgi:hypothetical protein